jgi:hypothetical protein
MADDGVVAGGGVLRVRGEGEGVAGGVVGGDVVVGERGGWSSRGVDGRAGDNSVQRGRTNELNGSAQSITIAHSVWDAVRSGALLEECSVRNARDSSALVVRSTRRNQENSPSTNNDRLQILALHARPVKGAQRARGAARCQSR